jgi:NADH:ubiquinone oxidoreductase subunit 2 (subunit N)
MLSFIGIPPTLGFFGISLELCEIGSEIITGR